ncbi:carboxypeptidase-like regulatory domain-containing protein [Mucilaginibacter sp. P25]|uniref:carboxypeptidase-like regulatory domain-containing protein n=1 Tax=Mucilaginibacter sp. P25 TaxID=3423945 RepID=UPI003D79E274
MPGVSVLLKGTKQGAVTGTDGRFSMKIPDNDAVLVFRYVGFLEQQVKVGEERDLHVVLKAGSSNLNEVVVIGYGTQKKSDIISSVASIKPESATRNVTLDVGEMLRGKAAGVQVTTNDAGPGALLIFQ